MKIYGIQKNWKISRNFQEITSIFEFQSIQVSGIFGNFLDIIFEILPCTRSNHTKKKSSELKHAKSALGSRNTIIMGENLDMAKTLKS